MEPRHVLAVVAILFAGSLVGAHTTMEDWNEQATFSVEQIDQSEIGDELPVLRHEDLSSDAQRAVRHAIESSDGSYTIYGTEDWPDRFRFGDTMGPGEGVYAISYDGQYYQLYTFGGGGFGFLFYPIPFIIYGLLLAVVAVQLFRRRHAPGPAAIPIGVGGLFHLIGPRFDFPLLASWDFFIAGIVATVVFAVALLLGAFTSEGAKFPISTT